MKIGIDIDNVISNFNDTLLKEINCPIIKDDTSYEMNKNNNRISFITKLDKNKIYDDLFNKLGGLN